MVDPPEMNQRPPWVRHLTGPDQRPCFIITRAGAPKADSRNETMARRPQHQSDWNGDLGIECSDPIVPPGAMLSTRRRGQSSGNSLTVGALIRCYRRADGPQAAHAPRSPIFDAADAGLLPVRQRYGKTRRYVSVAMPFGTSEDGLPPHQSRLFSGISSDSLHDARIG